MKYMQIEVTLVWKDEGRTQANIQVKDGIAPEEVTCGTSRFRRDKSTRRPVYIEVE